MASKNRLAKQYGIPYQQSWDQRHLGYERGVPDWMKQSALPPLMSSSSTHRSENEFLKKGSVMGDASINNGKLGTGSDPRGNAQIQAQNNNVNPGPSKVPGVDPPSNSLWEEGAGALGQRISDWNAMNEEGALGYADIDMRDMGIKDVASEMKPFPKVEEIAGEFGDKVKGVAAQFTDGAKEFGNAVKDAGKTATDFIGENATPIMAGMQVFKGLQQHKSRGGALDNLNDMISSLEGAEGGLANADHANVRHEKDKHSEQRRRIGEKGNIEMSRKLGKIRNANIGNIVSGSKKKVQESIKDEVGSETGITLASAYERHLENLTDISENDRSTRMEIGSKLEEMRSERDRLQKEQDNQLLNTTLDVVQTAAMASNPAAAMAIGVGRSFI